MQLYKLADEQWHFQKHWPMLLLLESGDPQRSAHSRLKDENSTSAQAWTERSTSSEGATNRAVSSARAGTESARRGQRGQQPSAGSAGARHPWDAAHGAPRLLPPTTGGTSVWLLVVPTGRRAPELPRGLRLLLWQGPS